MRALKAAVVGIVFPLSAVLAQNQPAPTPQGQPAPVDAMEHWRRSTVAVGEVVNGSFVTIGSAVLVSADNGATTCLLTARHVFFEPTKGWTPTSVRIRLPKIADSPDEDFGEVVTLNDGDKTYWTSPKDGADLAVIKSPDLSRYWYVNAVGIQDFGSDDDVFQGAGVMTLGYPMIPSPDYLISPIARGGMVAWVDPVNGLDVPFLIDSNIVHGNSGGPVFHIKNGITKNGAFQLGGGFSFIGIVSKNATEQAPVHVGEDPALRINQTTGKVEQYQATVENIGGIGVIEPVSKARTLVEANCPRPAAPPQGTP